MSALEQFERSIEALVKASSLSYEEIADSLEFLSELYRTKQGNE